MHKVFIAITLFIVLQSDAHYRLKLLFKSRYNASLILLLCVWEYLNCCCFIGSPMH